MAYTISDPQAGFLPINGTDDGIVSPYNAATGSTTTTPTPPLAVGMIVKGIDPTYGGGEFILLCGVASNTVGSLVTYNQVTGITTLAPNTANLAQPLAVSMSANVTTTKWSWYQIDGVAVIKKTATKVNPNVAVFLSATAGRIMATAASGKQLLAARSNNAATIASATSTVTVLINRVHAQGATT